MRTAKTGLKIIGVKSDAGFDEALLGQQTGSDDA